MEIVVKSRVKARKDSFADVIPKTAIISINTPGDELNKFAKREEIVDVLYLSFHDIGMRDETGLPMNEADAQKVVEFVKRCQELKVEELWVHCDGGISRSSGVAAAILKSLTGDDSAIYNNPRYCPNTICYNLVLNEFMKEV